MGPRRMDGFARPRPAGEIPAQPRMGAQMQRPVGNQPQARPQMQPRRAAQLAQRPVAQGGYGQDGGYGQAPPPQSPRQGRQQPAKAPRKTAGWKVALQFVIGLLVIVGVAAAIVALYIRYYQ